MSRAVSVRRIGASAGYAGGAIQVAGTLSGLQPAWDALSRSRGSPMLEFAWARAAAEAFGHGTTLHLLVASRRLHVRAIAPLFLRPATGSRLELVGGAENYEPMDFLYEDETALDELADALARTRVPVFLNRIPSASPVIGSLARSFRGRGVLIRRRVAACSFVPLDAGWTEPERRLGGRWRSSLRRARRIAEGMGPVRCEVIEADPASLGALLAESFRIEQTSWKGKSGTALAHDERRARFYRSFAASACAVGTLRVCFLRIGERAAAMQLAVESGGSFWLLKVGYDPEFHRCSPGMLLADATIRHAALRGLATYEFLGVVEPWTRAWTKHEHACESVRAYPAGWRGGVALAKDLLLYARRAAARGGAPEGGSDA